MMLTGFIQSNVEKGGHSMKGGGIIPITTKWQGKKEEKETWQVLMQVRCPTEERNIGGTINRLKKKTSKESYPRYLREK